MTDDLDVNEELATTIEGLIDTLAPLGFEGVVVCADGSEPFASLDLGDGRWLDLHAEVRTP